MLVKCLILSTLLTVSATSFAFAKKSAPAVESNADAGGNSSSSSAVDGVWVSRSDGAFSCSADSGQSVDDGSRELKKAGIHVLNSKKSGDGKMHMQMCGAPSGRVNSYLISRTDLTRAAALGYRATK